LLIRANQGHSDQGVTALELTPITSTTDLPNGIAIHGTYFDAWKVIRTDGLKKMGRNHIHFAVGELGAEGVISGMRSSAQVLIYLDIDACLAAKIPLFLSANSVVLSPGTGDDGAIAAKYFAAVIRASDNKPFDPSFPSPAPKVKTPAPTSSSVDKAKTDKGYKIDETEFPSL